MLFYDAPTNYTPSPPQNISERHTNFETISDNEKNNAFEGPEKLLEVWFAPTPQTLPVGVKPEGLKAVPVETWKEMLILVNCKVLSIIESEHVDAYLLSESSMFIFPHKLILKTCGTTTLLLGLSRILSIATIEAGFPQNKKQTITEVSAKIHRVFYSRKKFLFPDMQQGPHRCWEKEVEFLDSIFEDGSAYMVGKMNGDHWYLYLTSPNTSVYKQENSNDNFTSNGNDIFKSRCYPSLLELSSSNSDDDETLEILMTHLDEDNAKQFYFDHASVVADKDSSISSISPNNPMNGMNGQENRFETEKNQNNQDSSLDNESSPNSNLASSGGKFDEDEIAQGYSLGQIVTETCGLLDVYPPAKYPHTQVDSYLFSPCGFSANGIIPTTDGSSSHYFTVHVTPEPQCSYASFETNVPLRKSGRDTVAIVEQVVNIFKPGRFSVTLFEAKSKSFQEMHGSALAHANAANNLQLKRERHSRLDTIKGYSRTDRIKHEFDGYDLVFLYYKREDV